MDHLDSEQPIALSDSEELIAKLDNEALLAKFLDVNANFIALGPLARQFQELRYSQLRDELYRIDLEIRRRVLWGTPEHKAAVKAAHDRAWQVVRIAHPRAPNSPVPESQTGDRETVDPVVPQDTTSISTSASVAESQTGGREAVDPVVPQDTPPAFTSTAVAESQTGDREAVDPVVSQDTTSASTSAAVVESQTGGREAVDPVVPQDTTSASTSTMPSRTILAAWRGAIFALGHRRRDAQ